MIVEIIRSALEIFLIIKLWNYIKKNKYLEEEVKKWKHNCGDLNKRLNNTIGSLEAMSVIVNDNLPETNDYKYVEGTIETIFEPDYDIRRLQGRVTIRYMVERR